MYKLRTFLLKQVLASWIQLCMFIPGIVFLSPIFQTPVAVEALDSVTHRCTQNIVAKVANKKIIFVV